MNKKIKKKSKRFRFYIGIDVYDSINIESQNPTN